LPYVKNISQAGTAIAFKNPLALFTDSGAPMTQVLAALLLSVPSSGNSSHPGNAIGIELARQQALIQAKKGPPPTNFIISPTSLYLTLSMALNGASNSTRKELLTRLSEPSSPAPSVESINDINSNLIKKLNAAKPSPVLVFDNSLWRISRATDQRRFEFNPLFKYSLKTSYGAQLQSGDFKQQLPAETINILNTTYLEAKWLKPFQVLSPNAPQFQLLTGVKVAANMMAQENNFKYSKSASGEVISLDFATAQSANPNMKFYLYLPTAGTPFTELQSVVWTNTFWNDTVATLRLLELCRGLITLPKFSFESHVALTGRDDLTRAMNLDFLFNNVADFSKMGTPQSPESRLGMVKLTTRIELDEKGVRSAAANPVGIIERALKPTPPMFYMVVDRPFFFAIIEENTNAVLFVGSVVHPN
jgi:serine protease inhibitor